MQAASRTLRLGLSTACGLALATTATAQSYQNNTTLIPTGSPANNSFTENVDFNDVDGDGDFDALFADGGDAGNDRNRIWINQGGLQGGTVGLFVDATTSRLPGGSDDSRDVDFVDIDGDGDADVYISNTAAISNQSNRWWINQGGAQGGTAGFFVDETSTRWVNIGVNNGTTSSSVAPSQALGTGGFIDWSCDCSFADLDNDGDMDLVHTTYGGVFGGSVPSRLFLNDGSGFYEEHNPSGHQLSGTGISDGAPALWCEGLHFHGTTNSTGAQADIADTPLGVELGDLDGDFDVDIQQGARNETPRIYINRFEETGSLIHRDETFARFSQTASGGGNYEQELGDLDRDGDLDLYGLNWDGLTDIVATNDGTGNFGSFTALPGSSADDNEGDWFDYNNDGFQDIFVANFSGQDKLYKNDGPGSGWTHSLVSSELPSYFGTGLGADCCDTDNDGDYEIMVANDGGQANVFLLNVNNINDLQVPRIPNVEQAPDRAPGGAPTVIRAHVYDNSSWNIKQYNVTELRYSLGGLPFVSVPMTYAGGQVFRGEIPGNISGVITYEVRSTDEHGNTATSGQLVYTASGSTNYCTAGTSTNGCTPSMSTVGTPSASASSGFTVQATGVEGQKNGILFYGINGPAALSWGSGSSFLCVKAPTQRTGSQASGGTTGACDGVMSIDFLAAVAANPSWQGVPFSSGDDVWVQGWYRDPPAPKTTNLTDGITFTLVP